MISQQLEKPAPEKKKKKHQSPLLTEKSNCTYLTYSPFSETYFKNTRSFMSLNRENVQYILARFDAGIPPLQILNELQYLAYLPWINIGTVERCLCKNGRLQEIPSPLPSSSSSTTTTTTTTSNNQGRPGPSTSTYHDRQIPTTSPAAAVGKVGTVVDNLEDPGPTLPWNSLADTFTISAYKCGKSEDDIWVTLRRYGYDITRPEVVASLIKQGISGAR